MEMSMAMRRRNLLTLRQLGIRCWFDIGLVGDQVSGGFDHAREN
jgi:hypothetical protein